MVWTGPHAPRRRPGVTDAAKLVWTWRRFESLSVDDLYDLLVLRSEIFVVEQDCAFLDADGADRSSWHLLGRDDGDRSSLAACLRCVDPGIRYEEPSIGRVAVAGQLRNRGLGRLLMNEGIARTTAVWPDSDIVISAQYRLEAFYRSLGFHTEGATYREDGIDHVKMRRDAGRIATRTAAVAIDGPEER
jgi:ElaA protein